MRQRWLTILTVALAIIAGLIWSEVTHPLMHGNHNDQRHTERPEKRDSAEPEKTFWQRTADDPIAVFNLLLVCFTGVLAASTILLWLTSEKHTRHMGRSIDVAVAQAEAVREANRISQENLIENRRAWMGIIGEVKLVRPSRFTVDGAIIAVEFEVKNFGDTPATNVWLEVDAFIDMDGTFIKNWNEFVRRLRRHGTLPIGTVVFPNETTGLRHRQGIDRDTMQRAIAQRERFVTLILFIGTGYKIIGSNEMHVTCRMYGENNLPIDELRQDRTVDPYPFMAGVVD